jgi:hypothetical protein
VAALRRVGFEYDARRRLIRLEGRRTVALPFVYLGGDDQAGPNHTGQPAVHSHYRVQLFRPGAEDDRRCPAPNAGNGF